MEAITATAILAGLFAVQGVAIVRILNRILQKRRAEEKLEDEISRLMLRDIKLLNRANRLRKELKGGSADPEVVAMAYKFLQDAIKELEETERKAVLEGVLQTSERGRANYLSKLINESLEEAQEKKAAKAAAA
jgi:uncharacterized protein YoxC